MRGSIKAAVSEALDGGMEIARDLYDHPELGNEEFRSMGVLCDKLEAEGFSVTRGAVVPTGFIARYDSGKPGRTVAYLCEYDALPGIGHGCGHNLIAAIGLLCGIALKRVIGETGGTVLVVGTPAEENFGGKVSMAEAGVFDKVDAAMMMHPASETLLGARVNALIPLKFEFHGRTAHGCEPQLGRSALDAAVTAYTSISMLRQFMEPGCFLHGIMRNGGEAANVIPDYASLEYYFRAPTTAGAEALAARGTACAKAAAEAAGCTLETSEYECAYGDIRINYALADLLREKLEAQGVADIGAVVEQPNGSSDVGAVSYRCPTIHGDIKICGKEVAGHSVEMARATLSPEGRQALFDSACALADMGADLLEDDALYARVKAEFDRGEG